MSAALVGHRSYGPLSDDATDYRGGDFSAVRLDRWGKPECAEHGAMNKVDHSPPEGNGVWRCTFGWSKATRCRAACQEISEEVPCG